MQLDKNAIEDAARIRPDPSHYLALDGWRGICAVMVALFHFRANSHIGETLFIKSGGMFLDFFFVLSGFVIFANYYERLKSGYPLGKFMWLRFGRLYPLHFFIFFLFIFGDLLQLVFPFLQKGSIYPPFGGPGEGWRYVIANLFLLQSLGVTDMLSFNAPSWSISAEFYTYLVYALIIIIGRGRLWAIALATALIGAYMFLDPSRMGTTCDMGFLRGVYGFGCGALVWFGFEKLRKNFDTINRRIWTIIEAAMLLTAFACVRYNILFIDTHPYFLIFAPVIFSAVIFVFAFQKGAVSKVLTNRLFSLLGLLSYSIYMTHILVSGKIFYGVGNLFQKVTHIEIFTTIDGVEKIGTTLWLGDLSYAVFILSVVIFSFLTYRFIEVPCRDWFRRRAGKKEVNHDRAT